MLIFLSLAFGTLVSEDLACITAGLLIQRGGIGAVPGVVACTLGIFGGDVALWGLGRAWGHAASAWPWLARRLPAQSVEEARAWLTRHTAAAIVGSRFLPGTRLPLYVGAGVLNVPAVSFAGWALVGALLWTPGIVLLTARLGDAFVSRLSSLLGVGTTSALVAAGVVYAVLHAGRGLALRSTFGRIKAA